MRIEKALFLAVLGLFGFVNTQSTTLSADTDVTETDSFYQELAQLKQQYADKAPTVDVNV
jgi:hypothetical protein